MAGLRRTTKRIFRLDRGFSLVSTVVALAILAALVFGAVAVADAMWGGSNSSHLQFILGHKHAHAGNVRNDDSSGANDEPNETDRSDDESGGREP